MQQALSTHSWDGKGGREGESERTGPERERGERGLEEKGVQE